MHINYLKLLTKFAIRLSSGAKWFNLTENGRDSRLRGVADWIRENFTFFNVPSASARAIMAIITLTTIKVCIVQLLVRIGK